MILNVLEMEEETMLQHIQLHLILMESRIVVLLVSQELLIIGLDGELLLILICRLKLLMEVMNLQSYA